MFLNRLVSLNGDGPPKQTGLVITTEINCSAAAGPGRIAISRPNTTAINIGSWWDTMTVNPFFRTLLTEGGLKLPRIAQQNRSNKLCGALGAELGRSRFRS
jgi:hypothetical protein